MNKNRRIVIGSLLFGLASPSRRVQRLLRKHQATAENSAPYHSTTSFVHQSKSRGETHALHAFMLFRTACEIL
jgi:hypothetical protein